MYLCTEYLCTYILGIYVSIYWARLVERELSDAEAEREVLLDRTPRPAQRVERDDRDGEPRHALARLLEEWASG